MNMTKKYYFEKIEGGIGNFHIWEKKGNTYFNVATLFHQDSMHGTDWSVEDKTTALSYDSNEIQAEIENPLKQISTKKAQEFLRLTAIEEVLIFLETLFDKN